MWGGHSCPPPLTLTFPAVVENLRRNNRNGKTQKATSTAPDKSVRPTRTGFTGTRRDRCPHLSSRVKLDSVAPASGRLSGGQDGGGLQTSDLGPTTRLEPRTVKAHIVRVRGLKSEACAHITPFLFNTLHPIQCSIPPLNPRFSPFVDICVCFSHAFNNIRLAQSIRWMALTGVLRVKIVRRAAKQGKPGSAGQLNQAG